MDTTSTNTKTLFIFNHHDDVPQIPRLQDVLYVLELSQRQEYYSICYQNNDVSYLMNIRIVVEAVGNKVKALWPSDDAEARRIIARSIIDLCPEEARCLFREAFISAKRLAGDSVPGENGDETTLLEACTCSYCRETKRLRALSTD